MNDINLIGFAIIAVLGALNSFAISHLATENRRLRQAIFLIGERSDEMSEYLFGKDEDVIDNDSTGEWERIKP